MNTSSPEKNDNDPEAETALILRKGASDFLGRRHSGKRIRSLRGAEQGYERGFWKDMAALGWLSVRIDAQSGGLQLEFRHIGALAEEMGSALLTEPWIACSLLPSAILQGAAPSSLRNTLVQQSMAGERVLAVCWQEEPDQIEPDQSLGAALTGKAGALCLSGTKRFVASLPGADDLLVSARLQDELVIVHLPRDAAGISVQEHRLIDGTCAADVTFSGVPVSPDAILARGPAAQALLERALLEATAAVCAWQVALSRKALAVTVDYLKTRIQFGRVLASFQALQHRVVDLAIQVRRAEAALARAVVHLDHDGADPDGLKAVVSAAKACCNDASLLVTRSCIQLHGGMGFTDEADIGLYLRSALRFAGWLGSADAHRRRFMDLREPDATPAPHEGRADVVAAAASGLDAGGRPDGAGPDCNALSDKAFRRLFRDWLQYNLPEDYRRPADRLLGAPAIDWMQCLTRGGWRAPGWPVQYGGLALSIRKHAIYYEELDRAGAARWIDHGIWSLGDILMRFGSEAQRAYYLPRILSCEHVWAQGYSEPNAGSDLASLRTQAVREGDEWVINGQKIWTSGAAHATHIFLLVRTSQDVVKQRGISFLLVDLKTPGITIRPIRNLADELEFCEVFFENVRVPVDNLVGKVDQGWTVAKGLLGMERLAISSSSLPRRAWAALHAVGVRRGILHEPDFRRRLAQMLLEIEILDALYDQVCDRMEAGQDVASDLSILRILSGELVQRVSEAAMECAAEFGPMGEIEVDGTSHDIKKLYMIARPATIYGGTSEIQRNILSKRMLGMPDK